MEYINPLEYPPTEEQKDTAFREFRWGQGEYLVFEDGKVYSCKKNRFLAVHDNGKGYKYVGLYNGTTSRKFYIHRLVAEVFVSNPSPKVTKEVNHLDGDKSNNHRSNLRWVDRKQNIRHAWYTGLFDENQEKVKKGRKLNIGLRNSTREVIDVTDDYGKSGTNYRVLVRCKCGNEFMMFMNDFKKDRQKSCSKCRYDHLYTNLS